SAVQFGNDVACLQAGLFSGSIFHHVDDIQAVHVADIQFFGGRRIKLAEGDTDEASFNPPEFDEIVGDFLDQIHRYGEAITGVGARGGHDIRVDADELAR